MILPDTNIWIAHFETGEAALAVRLPKDEIAGHPYVIAELALGRLFERTLMLDELANLTSAALIPHPDVMRLIEEEPLYGSGIGYVDAHLVASCLAAPDMLLWTRDRKLRRVVQRLSILAPLA